MLKKSKSIYFDNVVAAITHEELALKDIVGKKFYFANYVENNSLLEIVPHLASFDPRILEVADKLHTYEAPNYDSFIDVFFMKQNARVLSEYLVDDSGELLPPLIDKDGSGACISSDYAGAYDAYMRRKAVLLKDLEEVSDRYHELLKIKNYVYAKEER